jgi:hypothetical protein
MIALPDCLYCRHCHLPESATCDAFPDGIPSAIFIDGRNHHQPYPGDHGILFERRPDAPLPREERETIRKAS